MKNKNSILLFSLFLTSLIGLSVPELMANYKFKNSDRKECIKEFNLNFIESSEGIKPPKNMAKYFCDCAENALNSGDTLTSTVDFCAEQTYLKFKKWYDSFR